MKLHSVAVAISGALALLVTAQEIPSCGRNCVAVAFQGDGCRSSTDHSCHCKNQYKIKPKLEACLLERCSDDEQIRVISALEALCDPSRLQARTLTTKTIPTALPIAAFSGSFAGSFAGSFIPTRTGGTSPTTSSTTAPFGVPTFGPGSGSSSGSSSSRKKSGGSSTPVGAIVGGVVGGFAALCFAAAAVIIFVLRRRRRDKKDAAAATAAAAPNAPASQVAEMDTTSGAGVGGAVLQQGQGQGGAGRQDAWKTHAEMEGVSSPQSGIGGNRSSELGAGGGEYTVSSAGGYGGQGYQYQGGSVSSPTGTATATELGSSTMASPAPVTAQPQWPQHPPPAELRGSEPWME